MYFSVTTYKEGVPLWNDRSDNVVQQREPTPHTFSVAAPSGEGQRKIVGLSRISSPFSYLMVCNRALMTANNHTRNTPHEVDCHHSVACCKATTARVTRRNLHVTVYELRNDRTRCAFIHAPGWGTQLEQEAISSRSAAAVTGAKTGGTTSGSQATPPCSPDNETDLNSTQVGAGGVLV